MIGTVHTRLTFMHEINPDNILTRATLREVNSQFIGLTAEYQLIAVSLLQN